MYRIALTSLALSLLIGCPPGKDSTGKDSNVGPIDADGDGSTSDIDCNDEDPSINPDAAEDCDPIDRNCDGDPTAGAADATAYYTDADGDGYGSGDATSACEPIDGAATQAGDCNDADNAYHPGATEDDCEDPNDYNCDGTTGYADADADGFAACVDCNDNDAAIKPDALESCNGVDDNCDGEIDNNPTSGNTYYYDGDADGHGRADVTTLGCSSPPTGYAAYGDDCNDTDPNFYPGAPEACSDIVDYNCDSIIGGDDLDGDGYQSCDDCDDSNAAINPGMAEICNTIDDDCDGLIDPSSAIDAATWYMDADNDGYGDPSTATTACTQPAGMVSYDTDCNDADARFNPGATETDCSDPNDYNCDGSVGYVDNDGDGFAACEECDDRNLNNYPGADEYCDGVDNNCDAVIDEATAVDVSTWYLDADHDRYGDINQAVIACNAPTSYISDNTDCDDTHATNYPGADEYCDGVDNNCDAVIDEDTSVNALRWYVDVDADGHGNASVLAYACSQPSGYVSSSDDCDDGAPTTYTGATEHCNGVDDNCDGVIDESTAAEAIDWYRDADGDNYGTTTTIHDCYQPTGYVNVSGDCDDTDAGDYLGATEIIGNNDDEDCNGVETCYDDDDNDGYLDSTGDTRVSADSDCLDANEGTNTDPTTDCDDTDAGDYPGATEITGNGDDEDCNGSEICFNDDDNDGYLDSSGDTLVSSDTDCSDSYEGTNTDLTTDCDDTNPSVNPSASEIIGNNVDDDCVNGEICYDDDDNDTYLDSTGDTRISADSDCLDAYEGTETDLTTDCDDTDAGDYPGAAETIDNGDDENCDGVETCYDDDDNDGYLDSTGDTRLSSDLDCTDAYEGLRTDPTTDCDDADASDYPGAAETIDNGDDENCDGVETCYDDDDNDGYLDSTGDTRLSGDLDCADANEGQRTDPTTDCDDTDSGDYPGATEITGNSDDESCDGTEVCFDDDDNDGYLDSTGDTRVSVDTDCADANEGTNTDLTTDCDDTDSGDYPGATETVGNGDDENCDGSETCYDDDDNDGYLDNTGDTRVSADTDCADANEGTNTDLTTDCNDALSSIYPGASEVVGDGVDQSCDGSETCYDDDDNDGYLDNTGDTRVSADADCADANEGTNADLTTDCNDAVATIYPGASEVVADGIDQNCNSVDSCYTDADGDNYGTTVVVDGSSLNCVTGTGAAVSTDCDDTDSGDYPGATEITGNGDDESCDGTEVCYDDDDNDGYLDNTGDTRVSTDTDCNDANEGTTADLTTDCDDTDSGDYPGATEIIGNSDDENCDGSETCYDDDDNDGYLDNTGDTRVSTDTDCADANEGTNTDLTTDCNDAVATIYPGASEVVADGIDQNCNNVDSCYTDADGDNYGTTVVVDGSSLSCITGTGAAVSTDCDDTDSGDYPGATETVGNGDDENCDGAETCYDDDDNDGYLDNTGDTRASTDTDCADANEGTNTDLTTDCNDAVATIYPGATEVVGDGIDQSCDGSETCYDDDDNDGYLDNTGDTRVSADSDCLDANEGTSTDLTTDCNDAAATVYPGASEVVADGIDQNCNNVDSCYTDADGDNYGTTVVVDGSSLSCITGTGAAVSTDCNDAAASIYPGATEVVGDSIDQSCDGTETCYDDDDNDGYLDNTGDTRASSDTDCADANEGTNTDLTTDCNDASASIYPGATETVGDGIDQSCDGTETCYLDNDDDGYRPNGTATTTSADTDCNDTHEAVTSDPITDCNDNAAGINPGATEICDSGNVDEDCDSLADDADSSVSAASKSTFYRDLDGDTYGKSSSGTLLACDATTGYVTLSTDCDDTDSGDYPGASEIVGNGDDESCDGTETCYLDNDDDGYRPNSTSTLASADSDCADTREALSTDPITDCDDNTTAVNPGASESCNGIDDNCTGGIDEGVTTTYYQDADSDAYGNASVTSAACSQPNGYVTNSTDCNDSSSAIHPGVTEICNGIDDNCTGGIDDGLSLTTWYQDSDADTYGNLNASQSACAQPTGYVSNSTDCNDSSAVINPAATEICDSSNVDEDCDGLADDNDPSASTATKTSYYIDSDHDGYGGTSTALRCDASTGYVATSTDCDDVHATVYPGGSEGARDTYDNDCDGVDDVQYSGQESFSNTKENGGTSSIVTYSRTESVSTNSALGSAIAGGLDVTGDTYPDVLIADRSYDNNATVINVGKVFVMSGSSTGLPTSLSSTTLQVLDSVAAGGARSGSSVAMLRDVNADTYNDVIVGSPAFDSAAADAGRATIFKGGPTLTGALDQGSSASVHMVVTGLANADLLGYQVSGIGDIFGGSASSDWATSAPQADIGFTNSGSVYLIDGNQPTGTYTATTAIATTGAIITGAVANTYLGTTLAPYDNKGDGDSDLLISAEGNNAAFTGMVYLFDGPLSAGVSYTTASATAALTSLQAGFSASNDAITPVSSAGDFNNDGYDDLLIGSPGYDCTTPTLTDCGAMYLYLGSSGGITSASSVALTAYGVSANGAIGRSVSAGGDVDYDGYDDLLIGAPNSGSNLGFSALVYGYSAPSGTVTLTTAGAYWVGASAAGRFGGRVMGVGDVNNDGWSDFMISAPGAVTLGSTTTSAYLFYGISQ